MEQAAAAAPQVEIESGREERTSSARRLRTDEVGEFIAVDDGRWVGFLEATPHSAYHLPGYLRVIGRHLGGEPLAYLGRVEGARCLIPLIERAVPAPSSGGEGVKDACSPPPYGGPVVEGEAERWPALIERFHAACRERGVVSVYLRNSPFLSPSWDDPLAQGPILDHGETVYIDLRQGEEAIWAGISARRRRGIRRAEKAGYHTRVDDWSTFPAFRAIYEETMERHQASPFWRFGDDYFHALRRELEDELHLCTVFSPSGEVAAAALYLQAGGSVEYHLGGSADAHRGAAPSHLLYDRMWRWARERGAAIFHLGGGLSSLMEFKRGFSTTRGPVCSLRLVPDPARYGQLLRAGGIDAPLDGSTGYFPAYREPE